MQQTERKTGIQLVEEWRNANTTMCKVFKPSQTKFLKNKSEDNMRKSIAERQSDLQDDSSLFVPDTIWLLMWMLLLYGSC